MVNFKEDEQLKTLNHSCAHLMAQAIKHLYPQAKFWVGPVVAEGFYYGVDLGGGRINKRKTLAGLYEPRRDARIPGRLCPVRGEIPGSQPLPLRPAGLFARR